MGRETRKPAQRSGFGSRRLGGLVLSLLLLAVAVVGAPVMIFSREGLPRLRNVEQELTTVEAENRQLGRDIDVLRARVATLRDDPAAVERLARDELGLVRQSEVVFQFPDGS